ncbi:transposase [Rhizobium tibeticum]|uniref:Transposase n=1 Tax=Rhizobium tibeticum TaxID=501024 RepID=A0A1H8XA08_9HYPH|nr:hypothetical protein RTCCBAU85039_6815 [Rhizobium tibeticum]SEP36547.1 transposase [Rhizobium tibeticum]
MHVSTDHRPASPAAICSDIGAILVSLELGKSTWLVTSLAPGSEKMSRYGVAGGDSAGLLACLAELRLKTRARTGQFSPW